MRLGVVKDFLHPRGPEELGRVRRESTTRNDRQVRYARLMHRILQGTVADDDLREPRRPWNVECLVQHRAAQIGVNEQRTLPLLRERDREVRDGGRLAIRGARARYHNGLRRLLGAGESQIRAHRPIRLGDRGPRIGVGDQARRRGVRQAPAVSFGANHRNEPEQRQLELVAQLVRRLHRVVKAVQSEGQGDPE
jgi:hypothetical protein